MPHIDFSCRQCAFFAPDQTQDPTGHASWACRRYGKHIDRNDPEWCVCRGWRPAEGRFPDEVLAYFRQVGPETLHHLRSRALYRRAPECALLSLV